MSHSVPPARYHRANKTNCSKHYSKLLIKIFLIITLSLEQTREGQLVIGYIIIINSFKSLSPTPSKCSLYQDRWSLAILGLVAVKTRPVAHLSITVLFYNKLHICEMASWLLCKLVSNKCSTWRLKNSITVAVKLYNQPWMSNYLNNLRENIPYYYTT